MPTIDLDTLRDPDRPLPADLRPIRTAVEALDLPALSGEDRGELERMAAALLQALAPYPNDWRRSDAPRCPRVVAGKRCRAWTTRAGRCLCERGASRVMDHARMWETPDGRVLTAEPYHVDGEELTRFVAGCHELGLRVSLTGASPYYPGATLFVKVERDRARSARNP